MDKCHYSQVVTIWLMSCNNLICVLGVSHASVSRIASEGRKGGIQRPNLKNDFDLCVIRRKSHEFYSVKKEIPTIKKLWTVLKEDINFPGGRESLRLLLHKMGYKFKKCRSQRQILIERFDIVAWREKYLTEIDSIKIKLRTY